MCERWEMGQTPSWSAPSLLSAAARSDQGINKSILHFRC